MVVVVVVVVVGTNRSCHRPCYQTQSRDRWVDEQRKLVNRCAQLGPHLVLHATRGLLTHDLRHSAAPHCPREFHFHFPAQLAAHPPHPRRDFLPRVSRQVMEVTVPERIASLNSRRDTCPSPSASSTLSTSEACAENLHAIKSFIKCQASRQINALRKVHYASKKSFDEKNHKQKKPLMARTCSWWSPSPRTRPSNSCTPPYVRKRQEFQLT